MGDTERDDDDGDDDDDDVFDGVVLADGDDDVDEDNGLDDLFFVLLYLFKAGFQVLRMLAMVQTTCS